ncbi:DUF2312 domain-containing protein [Candidatus Dependentiae bacterium]|nr:MAG: DUF2312 domain-containing protein [Candidatus Dependentiae bacterium]
MTKKIKIKKPVAKVAAKKSVVKKPTPKTETKKTVKKPVIKNAPKSEPVDELDDELEDEAPEKETPKAETKKKGNAALEAKKAKTQQLKEENKSGKGHNGGPNFGGVSGEQLRNYIERIEKLEEDKKVLSEDIKEVLAESKANGFDNKIIRKIIQLRKMDAAEREELETLIDLYKHALGMIPSDSAEDEDEDETL